MSGARGNRKNEMVCMGRRLGCGGGGKVAVAVAAAVAEKRGEVLVANE